MNLIISFFSFCLFTFSISNAQPNATNFIDVSEDIVYPKHYVVSKTQNKIVVDGFANEKEWQSAKYSDSFVDIEGVRIPAYESKFKLLWDDDFLYLFAYLEEPHIWANLKQRDTIIYFNNDFEVFIDPSGTTKNYGEIEINALGTVWDLLLDKPYRVGGKANNNWNLEKLKYAIHINGTLNNPNDLDSSWTIEMAIPMAALIELRNKPRSLPKEGEQWRINFSRVQWEHDIRNGVYFRKKENEKYLPEYNWVFSNQGVINMHEPEKWATLQFTHQSKSTDINFITDDDEIIKQVVFSLFRKTRFGKANYLLELDQGTNKEIIVRYAENKELKTLYYKTNFGFEYKLQSPITKKIYLINEEGVLKTL